MVILLQPQCVKIHCCNQPWRKSDYTKQPPFPVFSKYCWKLPKICTIQFWKSTKFTKMKSVPKVVRIHVISSFSSFILSDHFVNAPNQLQMTLHCNVVSHWLRAFTKWSLYLRSSKKAINHNNISPQYLLTPHRLIKGSRSTSRLDAVTPSGSKTAD